MVSTGNTISEKMNRFQYSWDDCSHVILSYPSFRPRSYQETNPITILNGSLSGSIRNVWIHDLLISRRRKKTQKTKLNQWKRYSWKEKSKCSRQSIWFTICLIVGDFARFILGKLRVWEWSIDIETRYYIKEREGGEKKGCVSHLHRETNRQKFNCFRIDRRQRISGVITGMS